MALVEIDDVHLTFVRDDGVRVPAVRGVSLTIEEGRTLAVIGESGSGKSTLGRLVLGLLKPDHGAIRIAGRDLSTLDRREMQRFRAHFSVVFQEPYESLNPRLRIGTIVAEPLAIHWPNLNRAARRERIDKVLREVDLDPAFAERYPHELSGGQQQRVGIARALIVEPDLVVLDEPTSSLDLSVRAQIILLLARLQESRGLSFLLITHDVASVEVWAHDIAVMRLGVIVEAGPAAEVLDFPKHDYSRKLLAARLPLRP